MTAVELTIAMAIVMNLCVILGILVEREYGKRWAKLSRTIDDRITSFISIYPRPPAFSLVYLDTRGGLVVVATNISSESNLGVFDEIERIVSNVGIDFLTPVVFVRDDKNLFLEFLSPNN